MFVNQFSATNSLLPALVENIRPETRPLMENVARAQVNVTTLDVFCQKMHIESIDLLKLDVQGFEAAVLRGGHELFAENRVASVYAEATFESHYASRLEFPHLFSSLRALGFEWVDAYGQTRNDHQGVRWCDMLFVNPKALRGGRNS